MSEPTLETDKIYRQETGTVVSIGSDGRAVVRLSRTKACEFCGQCSVSKEDGMMELQADIPEDEDIKVNDSVALLKKPGFQTKAIALLLLSPLLGLLLGAGIGYILFPRNEALEAFAALLGLFAAFIVSVAIVRKKKYHRGSGLTLKKL